MINYDNSETEENQCAVSGFGMTPIGGITLDKAIFESWRKYIYEICGIYFQDNKKYLLESRLQKRIKHLNLSSYEAYLDYLKYNPSGSFERKHLFNAITINETFFFRNQQQFSAITDYVLPEIINEKIKTKQKKVKIWSAASSTGDEAYSLAILINELFSAKYPTLSFEILGTDIDDKVIETAKNGVYTEYSIRNTPTKYLTKYFTKEEGQYYLINSKIKDMVKFKSLNLYDAVGMSAMTNYDLIICANVLIYFDSESKKKVLDSLYNSLSNIGFLFIGYSESLMNMTQKFKSVNFPKAMAYKKKYEINNLFEENKK